MLIIKATVELARHTKRKSKLGHRFGKKRKKSKPMKTKSGAKRWFDDDDD